MWAWACLRTCDAVSIPVACGVGQSRLSEEKQVSVTGQRANLALEWARAWLPEWLGSQAGHQHGVPPWGEGWVQQEGHSSNLTGMEMGGSRAFWS